MIVVVRWWCGFVVVVVAQCCLVAVALLVSFVNEKDGSSDDIVQDKKERRKIMSFKRIKEKEEVKKTEIGKEYWVGWRCVTGQRKLRMLLVKPISVKGKPRTLNPVVLCFC